MEATIRRLKERTEAGRSQVRDSLVRFASRHELEDWEGRFSPYDDQIHDAVLSDIAPGDVVLDIGAGDLRLALRLAQRAQKVYAIEVNPLLVAQALDIIGLDLPRNLHVICGNALDLLIPRDVTAAVLLMRHCQHFAVYFDRLQAAGCQRLFTNARWKSDVELIDLTVPGTAFQDLREGWYACRCGATGYVGTGTKPDAVPVEVIGCPACSAVSRERGNSTDG
jgi:SAM-dependent methyltransferase